MFSTTSGSVASWYFFAGSGTEVKNPTNAAFVRASTKSLGSIAFGSLIITVIRILRSMLNSARRNRNPFVMCCAYVLISIMERVIEYVTSYAFVYVAIYGKSFIPSCKCTMQLLSERGIDAIVNDDLTSTALSFIAFIFGLVSGGITYFIAYFAYHEEKDRLLLVACLILGLIVMILCMQASNIILAGIKTIFVCYAEDPAVLAETKPAVSERLTSSFTSRYPRVQLAPPARV